MSYVHDFIKNKYTEAVKSRKSCCGGETTANCSCSSSLYDLDDLLSLPDGIVSKSFGCGNPPSLASLHDGEVVLDLGSGAGLDVLIAARKVGTHGKVYGLDMTDEMLDTARDNLKDSGFENVEFIKGLIEDIPLKKDSVDVIISNCVINLSPDKKQVFSEMYRVLKQGGRIAVSDIVMLKPLPERVAKSLMAWAGCISGALTVEEYEEGLEKAGFVNIDVDTSKVYGFNELKPYGMEEQFSDEEMEMCKGAVASALISAKKPVSDWTEKEFNLRKASGDDLVKIERLLQTYGLTVKGVKENIDYFMVAESSEEIIASVGLEVFHDSAMIRSLAVDGGYRKRGLGKIMLNEGLSLAHKLGVRNIYLLTTTAEKFFSRLGFMRIKREEMPDDLQEGCSMTEDVCPITSICMKLS